ncbi:MAG: cytochrome ubiquinol oxidase subunit I, partial [Bauldia sp.]|nr:cytochrome ubiquinol oxidase subunit I [Bauldia sp.]
LTAFFLEATFLGIMLFGWNRVPPWLHVLSAVLVAIGTVTSAFWIISANSWMQYPAGHFVRDGIAYPADWIAAIFNPTFGWRLVHMVTAAYLTTAFVVLAVGARYFLAGRHPEHARTMLKMGIGMAAVLAPLQLLIGDEHGLDVAEYQPVKLAAIEGHWENNGPVPFVVFAIPNEAAERNDFQIAIPYAGSLLITRSLDGSFPALKEFPPEDRPPLLLPFFAFRIMVAIGFAMIGLALWGAWLWWRGRIEMSPAFMRLASLSWPFGFIAILSGWTVAEVGRQPWLAAGILRTADAASPVAAAAVAATLILFVLVYSIVFAAGILYINRLINRGPTGQAVAVEGVPTRPISAAEGAGKQVFGKEGERHA